MSRFFTRRWLWAIPPAIACTAFAWNYFQVGHANELLKPNALSVNSATSEPGAEREFLAAATMQASEIQVIQISRNDDCGVVGSTTDAVIKGVHVREGDRVRSGQVLVELEGAHLQKLVKQREGELAVAEMEWERINRAVSFNPKARELDLASAEAYCRFRTEDLDTRRKEFETYDKLIRSQAAREFEYFDAKSKYAQAHYYLTEAKRRLEMVQEALELGPIQDKLDTARAFHVRESAIQALDLARRRLADCQIRSPLDGLVDRIEVSRGQMVSSNQTLTQILQIDPIHVHAAVPVSNLASMGPGRQADLVFAGIAGEHFTGNVLNISPQSDPQTQTIGVILEVPNPQLRLRSILQSRVRIRPLPALADTR
jgi:multidrug efflux pump subunit AcrA (membrane-fusion protein)